MRRTDRFYTVRFSAPEKRHLRLRNDNPPQELYRIKGIRMSTRSGDISRNSLQQYLAT